MAVISGAVLTELISKAPGKPPLYVCSKKKQSEDELWKVLSRIATQANGHVCLETLSLCSGSRAVIGPLCSQAERYILSLKRSPVNPRLVLH